MTKRQIHDFMRYTTLFLPDDVPNPELWGVYDFPYSLDTTCLSESNKVCMLNGLSRWSGGPRPSVILTGHGDGIAVRVYRQDGVTKTDAFKAFEEMMDRLEEYPALDEMDWSQREYDLYERIIYEEMQRLLCNVAQEVSEDGIWSLCRIFNDSRDDLDTSEGNFPYEELREFVEERFAGVPTVATPEVTVVVLNPLEERLKRAGRRIKVMNYESSR